MISIRVRFGHPAAGDENEWHHCQTVCCTFCFCVHFVSTCFFRCFQCFGVSFELVFYSDLYSRKKVVKSWLGDLFWAGAKAKACAFKIIYFLHRALFAITCWLFWLWTRIGLFCQDVTQPKFTVFLRPVIKCLLFHFFPLFICLYLYLLNWKLNHAQRCFHVKL